MSEINSIFEVYFRILRKRPLVMTIVIILYAVMITTFTTIFKSEKSMDKDFKSREAIAADILTAIEPNIDVEKLSERILVIFNAHDRKMNGKLSEYGLVSILEDTFTLYSKEPLTEEKAEALICLINKQKVKDPYYGLRFEQAVIIRNLEEKLKQSEASTPASFIDEIKEVVRRQNIEIDELKKNNSLGIPIGFAGIGLTIIFGIIGLIYPFIRKQRANQSSELTSQPPSVVSES